MAKVAYRLHPEVFGLPVYNCSYYIIYQHKIQSKTALWREGVCIAEKCKICYNGSTMENSSALCCMRSRRWRNAGQLRYGRADEKERV